jgi:predicted DNA-binding transcriptional regulator YafY
MSDRSVTIDYTNWQGERATRRILPSHIYWGSNQWHPQPQWLMSAYDLDKHCERTFALSSIHSWSIP